VSISRDGNCILHRTGTDSKIIGTLIGPNNKMTFKPVTDMHYSQERLLEISRLMESMAQLRVKREEPDAPSTGTEDASRPRIVAETYNLFRGAISPDSKPIGSIQDGPVFAPAPGVSFSHRELLDIVERLRQRADAVPS
jgi:hypothetical protein